MRINTRQDRELENYFSRARASFSLKFFCTLFDLILVISILFPLFIIICYHESGKNISEAFSNFANKATSVKAHRLASSCALILFVNYIYFVLIPSKFRFQTIFSYNLNVAAITINDTLNWKGKIRQLQFFRANLIPIFIIPLLNFVFFLTAYLVGKDSDWTDWMKYSTKVVPVMKACIILAFSAQIHYMFTVAASRKALNYFTKWNGIIYVNVERAKLLMSTEDKPLPNKENLEQINLPGINSLALQSLKRKKDKDIPLDEFDSIDFSKEISV